MKRWRAVVLTLLLLLLAGLQARADGTIAKADGETDGERPVAERVVAGRSDEGKTAAGDHRPAGGTRAEEDRSGPPLTGGADLLAGMESWRRRTPPGAWVEYAVQVGGVSVGPWIRFLAVPGTGDAKEPELEIWLSQRPGSATQAFRLRASGEEGARGVVARLLGGPSRLLEVEAPAAARAAAPPSVAPIGEGPVQTDAGTFRSRAVEIRREGKRIGKAWIAEGVPLFGLVRLELASGAGLELSGMGQEGRGVVNEPIP